MGNPAVTAHRNSVNSRAGILLVSSLSELASLRVEWADLAKRCHAAPSVFQSFDWVYEWSKIYCNPTARDPVDLQIMVGRKKDKLVFVMPLMLRRVQGVKMLTFLTDPHGQYGDILCDRNENIELWVTAALELCRSNSMADILYLRHVRGDANLAPFAKQHMMDGHFNEQAPYLDLTSFKSSSDYDERYSPTQKKRRKKIRKHLQELGPVTFTAVHDLLASDDAIARAVSEKEIWLRDRGRLNRVMNCPRHVEFLQGLARLSDGPLKLVVTRLSAGDHTASWDISFRYQDINYCYITSHMNALNDLSPGRLHMDQSQRLSLTDGMKKFDLMVPNDPHKDSWCSGKMDVNDYYYAFSSKGRFYGTAYLGWLRPIIRKAYYSLPRQALVVLQPFMS